MYLDLKLAARRLLASPIFTIFAVLSLAVGVGVTTAVYSVVDALFLKDPGISRPDHVALIVAPDNGRLVNASISRPDFEDLRTVQRSFSSLSASAAIQPAVGLPSATEVVAGEAVDGAYFATLGIAAAMGRTIQLSDDTDAARVVVLSHKLWRRRFSSAPDIVGRVIRISGEPFEVVGVAPSSFEGFAAGLLGSGFWIPLKTEAFLSTTPRSPPARAGRDDRRLRVSGRLAPTMTSAGASAELASIGASLDTTFPPPPWLRQSHQSERTWSARVVTTITDEDHLLRRFGLVLAALVALVLAVACTNLSNLVLARGTTRRQVIVKGLASRETIATVIGIARDTDVGRILADPRALVYLPLGQRNATVLTITARSSGGAGRAVRALQQALYRADPDIAVDALGTGRSVLAGPLVFLTALGMAALSIGGLTLLLAMVGLFGIQTHVVSTRTHEIGVRMSFGASGAQIKRMVLKDGVRPVSEGLAIGLLIGLAGRGIVREYMEIDISTVDPWMRAVVPIPLILAGLCACYLPARRAAAVDPNVALRHL